MNWHHVLKKTITIICSLIAAAQISGSSAFAQEPAPGGGQTSDRATPSPVTVDQAIRQPPVIGQTDTTPTSGHQEKRRERPPDVRQDDKGTGKQETRPRQPPVSDSSLFKTKLDQSGTSVVGTADNKALKLKLQQPKPRVGPGPR